MFMSKINQLHGKIDSYVSQMQYQDSVRQRLLNYCEAKGLSLFAVSRNLLTINTLKNLRENKKKMQKDKLDIIVKYLDENEDNQQSS